MAAPPHPHPHPAILMDELVEEFLLLLPPEDPAGLARAALVSRQWHRVITGPVFRRRFREFHRSPPLLGYVTNLVDSVGFVPTSSFHPRHAGRRAARVRAVHSSHGRVLLFFARDYRNVLLSVWNPITDERQDLPNLPLSLGSLERDWDAAVNVICAEGDGCNHTLCEFKVFFVGRSRGRGPFSCFYSSESGSWSDPLPIFVSGKRDGNFIRGTCVLIGSFLYFMWLSYVGSNAILKYDLLSHQVCIIPLSQGPNNELNSLDTLIIATEDGRLGLGVAKTRDSTLRLWLREHGGWEERRTIELRTLLPDDALCANEANFRTRLCVAGFAEIGAGVIFLWTRVGYFTIDLNSGRSKKVGECGGIRGRIVPYMSFCTPAPGAVFKDEGPGAVAVSIDEGPGAGVVVSIDEGPGAGVAVSTDEVPGFAVAISRDEVSRAAVAVSNDEEPGAAALVSTDEGLGCVSSA